MNVEKRTKLKFVNDDDDDDDNDRKKTKNRRKTDTSNEQKENIIKRWKTSDAVDEDKEKNLFVVVDTGFVCTDNERTE